MKTFDIRDFERDCERSNNRNNDRNSVRENNRNNENDRVLDIQDRNCHQNMENDDVLAANRRNLDPQRLREECIIAFKVYDSCRQQDCLTEAEIGPARAAECICIGGEHMNEGDVIDPPDDAAAVSIDRLKIKRILVVDKSPNDFRRGFWDIDLKYVFEYRLTFREANGRIIATIRANSIFNKKVTLFGSIGENLAIATDLLMSQGGDGTTLDAEPFVLVEAKAVALTAELKYTKRKNITREDLSPTPNAVAVTIGLFTIIKLYRIVNLTVESRGFCIPDECDDISPLEPCRVFDNLDFPMDAFAPPQRAEFLAGVSGNIPRNSDRDKNCGCRS